jgi:hypothetical protein
MSGWQEGHIFRYCRTFSQSGFKYLHTHLHASLTIRTGYFFCLVSWTVVVLICIVLMIHDVKNLVLMYTGHL